SLVQYPLDPSNCTSSFGDPGPPTLPIEVDCAHIVSGVRLGPAASMRLASMIHSFETEFIVLPSTLPGRVVPPPAWKMRSPASLPSRSSVPMMPSPKALYYSQFTPDGHTTGPPGPYDWAVLSYPMPW